MQVLKYIGIILTFSLFMGCDDKEVILIDSTKRHSNHQFHHLNKNANKPKVEFAKPLKSKKKITYNNRMDIIINKFKLDNLKNDELDSYIKSLFTLYRESAMNNFLRIPITEFGEDYIRFQTDRTFKNNFDILIQSEPFILDDHTYDRHKNWYLYKIDGEPFLGTDGTPPSKSIKSMDIKINNKKINFPEETFNDLYEPNFCRYFSEDDAAEICYMDAMITEDYKYLFVLMEGGEAAGVYEVIWVFRLGQFYTRSINIPY